MAATNKTIVTMGEAMRKWLPEGWHVCPECMGGYLSVTEATLPAGFASDEMRNRAVPKEK